MLNKLQDYICNCLKEYKLAQHPKIMVVQIGLKKATADKIIKQINDINILKPIIIDNIIYPNITTIEELAYLTLGYEQNAEIIGYIILGHDTSNISNRPKNITRLTNETVTDEICISYKNRKSDTETIKPAPKSDEIVNEESKTEIKSLELPEKYRGKKHSELLAILKEHDIKFKFGIKKDEVIQLIIDNNL